MQMSCSSPAVERSPWSTLKMWSQKRDGLSWGRHLPHSNHALGWEYEKTGLCSHLFNLISILSISPARPGSKAQQPSQCPTVKSMQQSMISTGHLAYWWLLGERSSQTDESLDVSGKLQQREPKGPIAGGSSLGLRRKNKMPLHQHWS